MNVKKNLKNRIKGWFPKTPNLPKQPSTPSLNQPETFNEKGLMNRNFPVKSSTNLLNGILIGGSAAALLISLLLITVNYIAFCSAAVVYSCYLIILASIYEFSPTVRILQKYKKTSFALAAGFLNGGAISICLAVANTVFYSYPLASTSAPNFSIIFESAGAILVIIGTLWIAISFLKFRESPAAQGAPQMIFHKFVSELKT
jgi:hypothetical protein